MFQCKENPEVHSLAVSIPHSSKMYDVIRRCRKCRINLETRGFRCGCCGSPLKCSSKRSRGGRS